MNLIDHTKCGVVNFGESKALHFQSMSEREWTLGNDVRELKQTDAAAVNRQNSIQIQSDGCQGPTEFTWP